MRIFLLFFAILGILSCQSTPKSPIDAAQLEKLMAENPDMQLVDLRFPEEVAQTGKIDKALTYNISSPDFKTNISTLRKEKPVILYCAAGSRSARAAVMMKEMGFKHVLEYTGGMNDWLSKGKKTVQ